MARYQEFIKLAINHSYYSSGVSDDLLFYPTADTKKTLKRQRILYKAHDYGFRFLAETTEANKTTIKIDKALDCYFGIGYFDSEKFLGITDLNESAPSTQTFTNGCRIFLYNETGSDDLKYKVIHAVYQEAFSFQFSAAETVTEIKITIKNENGTAVVADFDSNGNEVAGPYIVSSGVESPGKFNKFFNFKNAGKGFYTIEVKNNATNSVLNTYQVIVHNELSRSTVSGVLRIHIPAVATTFSTKNLTINFNRASTKWKYYLSVKSGLDLDDIDLVITDKSGDSGSVYNTYTFNGNPASGGGGQADPDIANSIGGYDTLVFESIQKIPFYEIPKKQLELKRIEDGQPTATAGNVIFPNLPNPKPKNREGETSKIYLNI